MVSVSVIVPVYQGESTIVACARSVLNQDYASVNLIIVDDGSTDATKSLTDRIAAEDDRVKIVHTANRGRQAARLRGVELATSEWITFVDADDCLPVDAVSLLAQAITDDVDIIFGNGYSLNGESRNIIPMDDFRHMAVRGDGTIGVPWGSLYRRSVLTPYLFNQPKNFCMGEDYIFWLRLVFSTEKPVAVVFDKVYDKGDDTTSASFSWTVDYVALIQKYRMQSIPPDRYEEYIHETIADRLANLCAVALCQRSNNWRSHSFTLRLKADIARTAYHVPLSTYIYLSLPSLWMRKLWHQTINLIRV